MKLEQAIDEIELIQNSLIELEERRKKLTMELTKIGTAVFSSVSQLAPAGASRVEFQSGNRQYAIDGSGTLSRINEVEQIDQGIEIEVSDE